MLFDSSFINRCYLLLSVHGIEINWTEKVRDLMQLKSGQENRQKK